MKDCVVLTNRKRTIIALVHTIVFLIVALCTMATEVTPLRMTSAASPWILTGVFLVVTSALLVLTAISGNSTERLYFGLCATSAGFGLLRQLVGDPGMHAAVYIRVVMLAGAVWTALLMLRTFRSQELGSTAAVAD
jgi:hypothetical protein